MEEKVAVQEVWRSETGSVMALVQEKWDTLWAQADAQELGLVGEEGRRPETLAQAWALFWGKQCVHTFAHGENDEEKRKKYLYARAAQYVYALRHLSHNHGAYEDYLWWCEKLFPLTRLYCEHTGRLKKER